MIVCIINPLVHVHYCVMLVDSFVCFYKTLFVHEPGSITFKFMCLPPTNIAIIIVYTVYAFFLMPIKGKLVKYGTTFIIS